MRLLQTFSHCNSAQLSWSWKSLGGKKEASPTCFKHCPPGFLKHALLENPPFHSTYRWLQHHFSGFFSEPQDGHVHAGRASLCLGLGDLVYILLKWMIIDGTPWSIINHYLLYSLDLPQYRIDNGWQKTMGTMIMDDYHWLSIIYYIWLWINTY
jgi:hypothetical protein